METHEQRMQVLQNHKHDAHHQSHFQNYFKEVIYGGIDGIITTFAVVAGFSGAALSNDTTTQLSFLVVLLFGLANLFADGVSMGLGNFLAVRSDQDLYRSARKKEEEEVSSNFQLEFDETVTILIEKGYEEGDATELAKLYSKNKTFWIDFMMEHELEMPDPTGENPMYTGLVTFSSFVVFGSIPLLPFIVTGDSHPNTVFMYSIFGTFFALVMLGVLKWKITGVKISLALIEVLLVGGSAATVAFLVGSFFSI